MVKPRLIILIRHAQSEGNKNREIHQMIPDHRVKLTEEGHKQAEEAGRRLRALLKPDDTLQIYTSPYRRTRETTEGILKTLTARDDPDDPTAAPSPFSRNKIKVYEEPRIREQDFGNFQPCSAEMERMWQERADYGHFFYRIPDGESAADAYDRISGFNESLWRQFSEDEFPSVCVLVTHGLMTRVFLMKWYHWSVEYFEDLRNINHCEFITMHKDESGKYVLQNKMRTWSELKRQKREAEAKADPQRRNTLSHFLKQKQDSPSIPPRKWGGCKDGCNHQNEKFPRRAGQHQQRKQTQELTLPSPLEAPKAETEDTPMAHVEPGTETVKTSSSRSKAPQIDTPSSKSTIPEYLQPGRDGGGLSGVNTPHESSETEGATGYFESSTRGGSLADAIRKGPQRKATPDDIERWAKESGMNAHRRADPLGDEAAEDTEGSGDVDQAEREERSARESVY